MSRKTLFIVLASVVVLGSIGFFAYTALTSRATYLTLPGIVEIQEVRLGSKVGGRVAKVEVREGDEVKPGQPLVTFDVPELENQRDQWQAKLYAAQADLEKARNGPRLQEKEAALAAADAARAKYERMKIGWREEEKRQAAADLESAEAELTQAREDYDRIAELYRKKSAARSEYDTALGIRNRAAGKFNSFKARNDMLQAGNRPEDINQALQEWKQAQANYELLKIGTRPEEIAMAQARVDETKARLAEINTNWAERTVTAPEHAVVEVVSVRKGDLVPANQPVVRVLRAEDMWVKVFVSETDLGKLRLGEEAEVRVNGRLLKRLEGQQVDVQVDAYPTKSFKGKIIQVASISEYTPRNVQSLDERRHQVFAVKVRVDDPKVFKSGMAAEVRLPLAEAP